MANGTKSEEYVVLSRIRPGLKREFAFAMKSQTAYSDSVGRTRARRAMNALENSSSKKLERGRLALPCKKRRTLIWGIRKKWRKQNLKSSQNLNIRDGMAASAAASIISRGGRKKQLHLALRSLTRQRFSTDVKTSSDSFEANPSFIHPSSIVHPNAIIGQGVSVGPFCTVGSLAKLGNGCQLSPGSHVFGNTELGDNCILKTGAVVGDDLPGHTVIGRNNVIGHHAVVGIKCQDMKYKPGIECFLEVGNNNEIREHVSIHRSSKPCDRTVIGDNNLIMGSCHIAHDCKVGSNNIFANSTLLAGHVVVEDYAHSAGAIVVHQFCHIGAFCFIGGGSVVSQDVPKYTMVSGERAELRGLNLEGLRRRGFSVIEIKSLRAAYRKIFMAANANSGGIEDRIAEVEQHEDLAIVPAVHSLVQSIRDSFTEDRRGICKFRSWSDS